MPAQPSADTLSYMLAGYGVIFGVVVAYLVSLVVRWKSLQQDEQMLEQLDDEKR